MPEISRGRALAYVLALLALLALGGRYLLDRAPAEPKPAAHAFEVEPPPPRTLVVHVVGAVRAPGLYELAEGSRIDDAIERAGGPKA